MGYKRDEMETVCTYDYKTKSWEVYTNVPKHITKLSKMDEPIWKEVEPDVHGKPRIIAGKWILSRSQVRFAKMVSRNEEENVGSK